MPRQQPLKQYLPEQISADREMYRVLELAARQTSAEVRRLQMKPGSTISDRVRIAQLNQVLERVTERQNELWVEGIGPIIRRSLPKVQAAAKRSARDVELMLENAVGERRAEDLIRSFHGTVNQSLELDRLRRTRELSPRVFKNSALSSGALERTIRAGIIQGLSAEELARNVRQYVSARTPGGVGYAAMRLARTELNNAFHEAQKLEAQAPWVRGVKWNLSGTHPTGKPDKCDQYAMQDVHDMGPGLYPPDRVPDKPHPQCLCYTTFQMMSETDLLDMLPELIRQRTA